MFLHDIYELVYKFTIGLVYKLLLEKPSSFSTQQNGKGGWESFIFSGLLLNFSVPNTNQIHVGHGFYLSILIGQDLISNCSHDQCVEMPPPPVLGPPFSFKKMRFLFHNSHCG